MKKLILKAIIFFFLAFVPLILCLYFLPDPKSEKSVVGAVIDRHEMLSKLNSPKIILVGGSNVGMGFNSLEIINTFKLPVINSGISGWFGLKYIVNDIKPYINKGDVVVLCVSYSSYENTKDNDFIGNNMFIPVLFDIDPKSRKNLDLNQWKRIAPFLGHYTFSKIKQLFFEEKATGIYQRNSFNKYGDFVAHLNLPKPAFVTPEQKCTGNEGINPFVIPFLQNFKKFILSKGATLVILPPSLQESSFDNQIFIIQKIDSALKKNNLSFIANPARYKFDNKYIYDFEYHLNKPGVEINTKLAIEDLSKVIPKKSN
jgi:hypothetical protein